MSFSNFPGPLISCDHTGAAAAIPVGVVATAAPGPGGTFHLAQVPAALIHYHPQQQVHPTATLGRAGGGGGVPGGYVTLPRRPRGGWSTPTSASAAAARDTPSPGAGSTLSRITVLTEREPIYDGVGPR